MMFGEEGIHGFFGGGFMWILWIVLIVVIVYVLKDLIGGSSSSKSKPEDDALDILKRRYAQGEIDEAEFERRKKELESN